MLGQFLYHTQPPDIPQSCCCLGGGVAVAVSPSGLAGVGALGCVEPQRLPPGLGNDGKGQTVCILVFIGHYLFVQVPQMIYAQAMRWNDVVEVRIPCNTEPGEEEETRKWWYFLILFSCGQRSRSSRKWYCHSLERPAVRSYTQQTCSQLLQWAAGCPPSFFCTGI